MRPSHTALTVSDAEAMSWGVVMLSSVQCPQSTVHGPRSECVCPLSAVRGPLSAVRCPRICIASSYRAQSATMLSVATEVPLLESDRGPWTRRLLEQLAGHPMTRQHEHGLWTKRQQEREF